MAKDTKVVTKMDQARAIFKRNIKSIQAGRDGVRAKVLGLYQSELGLTPGAASTYYQSVRKENIVAGTLVISETVAS
jgi:hypothetical protein